MTHTNNRDAAIVAQFVEGDTLREIGDAHGMSYERVRQIVRNRLGDRYPKVNTARVKTRREKHRRASAGATTCACGGPKSRSAVRCSTCANDAVRWTRETIIAAAHAWRDRYGVAPSATAWNPAALRKQGKQGAVDVFYSGQWPRLSTVQRVFGKWSNMLHAAGMESQPSGGAGHGKQPTTTATPPH